MEPQYTWGSKPLDDVEGCIVREPLHLRYTPSTWVDRQVTVGCHQQLMDEVNSATCVMARVPVFVMHVELDRETKECKPLPKKYESKQAMLESKFWIIGGQTR